MNITIVGGGNIGTQLAVHAAAKGHNVWIYTSKPEKFDKELVIVNEKGQTTCRAEIQGVTDDAETAFSRAECILVTMPAFCMKQIAQQVVPYVADGTYIGLIPGTGGGECAFKDCLEKGCVIFGVQRVPSVARLVTYGKTVCASGYRKELFLAALPAAHAAECSSLMTDILDMPCKVMPNYLNVTLTPSNPILHTTRLRTLFEDYREGVLYDRIPLFYEEWSDQSSELLLKCDEEVQSLCKRLKEFDLSHVRSLKEHYENNTVSGLTNKLRSIESLKGIPTPSVEVGGKFIPDLSSRYFTADFPYGLVLLKQIADFCGFNMDNINNTLEWYDRLVGPHTVFSYQDYSIASYEDFKHFYLK